MTRGHGNRAVGSHDMNEHSSRSHSITILTCRGKNNINQMATYGKLHLIDLAGSERLTKTGETMSDIYTYRLTLSSTCLFTYSYIHIFTHE